MRMPPLVMIGVILQEDAILVLPEESVPELRERLARLTALRTEAV